MTTMIFEHAHCMFSRAVTINRYCRDQYLVHTGVRSLQILCSVTCACRCRCRDTFVAYGGFNVGPQDECQAQGEFRKSLPVTYCRCPSAGRRSELRIGRLSRPAKTSWASSSTSLHFKPVCFHFSPPHPPSSPASLDRLLT